MKKKLSNIMLISSLFLLFFMFTPRVEASVLGNNSNYILKAAEGNCNSIFGDPTNMNEPAYWLQWVLNLLKYVAILALLAFVIIDFFKALVDNDKDGLKKALTNTIKRVVYCIIIFFLPDLISLIMSLFGAYGTCVR